MRPHLRDEGRRGRRRAAGGRGRRGQAAPLMVGREPAGRILPRAAAEALRATRCWSRRRGLALAGAYRDVDFALHAGEILGIAGVDRLRPRGADPHAGGLRPARRRHADGRAAARSRFATPAEAVDAGIGYIPRERRIEGLVLFLPVAANITLAEPGRAHRYGLIDAGDERALAAGLGRAAAHPHPGDRRPLPQPLGRQPAEGGAGEVAGAAGRTSSCSTTRPAASTSAPRRRSTSWSAPCPPRACGVILTSDTLEETIGLSHTVLVMRDGAVQRGSTASPATSRAWSI